jgi:hypothetical protein
MTDTSKRGEPEKQPPDPNERRPRPRPEAAREQLIRDPNLNQAGNDRGSLDQTQGSQTGNDIDTVPEP